MDVLDAGIKILEVAGKLGDDVGASVLSDSELERRLDGSPPTLGLMGSTPLGLSPSTSSG